ncbi:MAG: A/G-specific adenine glycosylase [Balneolaceae bacterium]|nr:MAG: A/G-specific adenine glycosylase [Balneolaceae bacterium]
MSSFFTEKLAAWYQANKRDLPWRRTDDPYKIWVSEIMLQQTRVETVIPYFRRFVEVFPTVFHLAAASQQQVLKCWEGLGYYSRGRNLHQAAKTVVEDFDGKIPSTHKEISKLKGIGPYSAAAILSIAFNRKYAVVDGNVIRVITRFYGIPDDIRKETTKKHVQELADDLIDGNNPGDFNQAVMELGALICTPKNPACHLCPVSQYCISLQRMETDVIPYKSPSKKIPHKEIAVGLIVNEKNELLIALRPNNSMLGGLWEFPGGKREQNETLQETVIRELKEELGVDVEIYSKFRDLKHTYSHFKITLHAFWCKIINGQPAPKSSQKLVWVGLEGVDHYPFPKANKTLLNSLKKMDDLNLKRFLE